MSKGIVNAHLIGRFGNQCFQYCYARKYAEMNGLELRTNSWPGQQIFEGVSEWGEWPMVAGEPTLPENYRQTQDDLIYTRADCRRWFKIKDEWLDKFHPRQEQIGTVIHFRRGDYASCGYVVVSAASYWRTLNKIGVSGFFESVCEETPTEIDGFPFPFLSDFMRLMHAKTLLRANSSFSWWAATLSNAKIYSPVIDGLEGGKEQDCEFIESNAPRFANLPFVTNLHLKEE